MQRVLWVVIILYVVWRVLYAYGRRIAGKSQNAEDFSRFSGRRRVRRAERGFPASGSEQELVKCNGCGTYVPRERLTATTDGRLFCSEACREEHALRAENEPFRG